MLRIGETIDRYKVEALIGQGGMAAVFRARHLSLDSEHAIKVLFITAPQIRERLLREGKVQANLRHPNVVSVTDVLEVQGAPALVMEYIDGPALDAWLLNHKPTVEEAMWLFRGILRGVSAAHERGVVHRDLKPANIMLSRTNEGIVPKVTDFGLVKSVSDQKGHTQTGLALGTPEYMAPEQIRDASDVDQRADMFALGCILYELVCHKRAFGHPDKMSTFNAIVAGDYEPPRRHTPELPQEITEAIRWCLEVEREKRLASCLELFDLLYEDTSVGRLGPPSQAPSMLHIDPDADAIATFGVDPTASPRRGKRAGGDAGDPALAAAPTGKPAAQRRSAPTQLQDTAPAPLPSPPRAGRGFDTRLVVLASLFVVVVGVGSGVVAGGLLGNDGLEPTVEPPDPTVRVEPVAPDPAPVAVPTTEPEPEPAKPEPVAEPEKPDAAPVKPQPEPVKPQPEPVKPQPEPVKPEPVRPQPAPVTPEPLPVPVPAPPEPGPQTAPAGVAVSVTGDATSVWLVSTSGQTRAEGAHPPGSYQIVADFGEGQVPSGNVTLRRDQAVTLDCRSFILKCLPK